MRSSWRVAGAIGAGLLVVAGAARMASGHETWLQPSTFFVGQPVTQIVRMTSGMGYPTPGTPIEPTRLTKAGVILGATQLALTPASQTDHELTLRWTPTRPGVAAVFVELAPRRLELPDSLINSYFDEIGAPREQRRGWNDTPSPKKWREMYAKHAKTYVRVGDPKMKFPWRAKTGMGLEIVPESDPTLVAVGDTFRVRVLRNGLPVSNFKLASRRGGDDKPQFLTTDKFGRAWIVYSTAMPTLLSGVSLRRVKEKNLEWRSDFTSMSFIVLPKR